MPLNRSLETGEIVYRLATRHDAGQLADLRWIHEAEAGNPAAGDPAAGYPAAGYPAAGDPAAGDPAAGDRDAFAEGFRAFLDRELGVNYACCVAEVDGRLVANIYVGMIDKVPKPGGGAARIGYVTNVHTLAEYRNGGIGSRLMAEVQAWARRNGFELLFVWPSQRSIPFYQRLGFEGENDVMECDL